MKTPIKTLSLALALLLASTSLGFAKSNVNLDATPQVKDPTIVLVADDDDFHPHWWRLAKPTWQGGDWDDDDRWDDDDDDRWDDDDDDD